MKKSFLFLLTIFLLAFSAQAAVISFGSGDGLNESNDATGTNVLITPHPLWGLPSAPYSWVSHVNSGIGGIVVPNTTVPTDGSYGSPTAVFTEYLPLGTYMVDISHLYTDDTAGVRLYDADHPTGLLLKAPNPVQGDACAISPVSCTLANNWTASFAVKYGSPAWLTIAAYQVSGDTFGVAYDGVAYVVPEPGTYLMLAGGLAALAFLRRRKT